MPVEMHEQYYFFHWITAHVCEIALVDVPKCFGEIGAAEEYSCMVVLFFLLPSL